MEQQVKRAVADSKLIASAFWSVTCMAYCTGLAVSLSVAGMELLIVMLGST